MTVPVLGEKHTALAGVLVPETTPFLENGDLDEAAFTANVKAHLASGVSGVVTAGSTGEAALLDEEERLRLVELARAAVPAEKWVIVGVGAESTRMTIRRAREAAARGADAVLVVAPHYYGASMTDPALEAHYRKVADGSFVPVILYNIPKYAHLALSAPLVERLSNHGNITGIKDSSGEIDSIKGYLASQKPSFTVVTGSAQQFLTGLDLGARGGILGVACFAAARAVELFDAHARGDIAASIGAQARLLPLGRDIVGAHGPAGVKAAMNAIGLKGGSVRSPLRDVDATQRAAIVKLITQ
jgi:4-hydroxy-2-oxoglutarate aldolase